MIATPSALQSKWLPRGPAGGRVILIASPGPGRGGILIATPSVLQSKCPPGSKSRASAERRHIACTAEIRSHSVIKMPPRRGPVGGGHFDCHAVGVAIKTQLKRGSEQIQMFRNSVILITPPLGLGFDCHAVGDAIKMVRPPRMRFDYRVAPCFRELY